MTKLYLMYRCPFGHRAAFALAEKKIEHETVFFEHGKRPPELEAVGPYAKSPTLFDGDDRVFESSVVLEYLEDRYPDVPLMPRSAQGRADVRALVARIADEVAPKFGAIVMAVLKPQPDPEKVAEARSVFLEKCASWDRLLEGRTFLLGDTFTLADITLYTFFPAGRSLAKLQIETEMPNLRAWIERVSARPASKLPTPPT